MPTAEIITIGTELLLGEIVDTNARYLARYLRALGIDLYRKSTVGDNVNRIAKAIRDSLERPGGENADIVVTTGGLGPTVDDPTRQAVAQALGVGLEFRPDLWDQIQVRFRRFSRTPTENNQRQAYLPAGAIPVENPVGTAPAFICEVNGAAIIALPGVPREMEYLLENAITPYLRRRFRLDWIIKTRILHTAGVGESQIDDRIGDLETSSNPTIGLAAHSGQVDVRITAKAASEPEANRMIQEMESVIRDRLGEWIYGMDQETLEQVALNALLERGWRLAAVETGLRGELVRRLSANPGVFLSGEVLAGQLSPEDLLRRTQAYRAAQQAEVGLGITLLPAVERQEIHLVLITPEGIDHFTRPFGGPPGYAGRWAVHHSLDILRQISKGAP
jgi:competence/damage-inducible protein CinA-like protein